MEIERRQRQRRMTLTAERLQRLPERGYMAPPSKDPCATTVRVRVRVGTECGLNLEPIATTATIPAAQSGEMEGDWW